MESLGQHIIAEYFDCDQELLNNVSFIERTMLDSASEAGATIVSSSFHHFSPYGISGVVVIQESHLAIHTWPEYHFASVDLFTCGDTVDPLKAYEYLKISLKAANGSFIKMSRGSNLIADYQANKKINIDQKPDSLPHYPMVKRESWFTQRSDNMAFSIRHRGERLYYKKQEGISVEVYDTFELGKMLVINGQIIFTEEEEHIYHEMLVHPAMKNIYQPLDALIIGGTDGGTIRELLKYKNVLSITLSGINLFLYEVFLQYFPAMVKHHKMAKVHPDHGNTDEFIKKCPDNKFDILFIDPDTEEFNRNLKMEYFEELYRIMKPNGVLIWPNGSLGFNNIEFSQNLEMLIPVFRDNICCFLANSLKTFKLYTFFMCGKGKLNNNETQEIRLESSKNREIACKYYNLSIYNGSFFLPESVKSYLNKNN